MAISRKAITILTIALVTLISWVAMIPWQAHRLAVNIAQGTALPVEARDIWLAANPPRLAARTTMTGSDFEPALSRSLLQQSLQQRPLYAPTLADLAELAWQRGDNQEAVSYANHARDLWPTRSQLLFRLMVIHLNLDDSETAGELLHDYVRNKPADFRRAATIARELIKDNPKLIRQFLPKEPPRGEKAGFFDRKLLAFAIATNDVTLSLAAWETASKTSVGKNLGIRFVEFLIAKQKIPLAFRVHSDLLKWDGSPPTFFNGSFESPLHGGGMGWLIKNWQHVQSQRDSQHHYTGKFSLRLDFDGMENLQYHDVKQRLLVESGKTYELSGVWRGMDLSTRSGVFLTANSRGKTSNIYEKTESRTKSWEWKPWSLVIKIPDGAQLVTIGLRRDETMALDRKFSGSVWLDGFSITEIAVDSNATKTITH